MRRALGRGPKPFGRGERFTLRGVFNPRYEGSGVLNSRNQIYVRGEEGPLDLL